MAGLKRLVGVTLAVVLVTAWVVYVLRPSATTTTSVVNEPGTPTVLPPGDLGACRDQPHGLYPAGCHPSSATDTGSGGSGKDNETDDHNETGDHHSDDGDHDGNDNDGHGHEWGESGDHDDDNDNHGDHHSDHEHGESEHDDP